MDIFDEIRRLEREMDRLFEDFGFGRRRFFREFRDVREPIVDVWEDDEHVFVTAELPGVSKDNIDLNVTENAVEIKAELKSEKKEEGKEERKVFRSFSSFYKYVSLPSAVDPETAEATFSNGVLEVKIRKQKVEKKRKVEIKEK